LLSGFVVAADVTVAVTERACHAERADDLLAISAALWALEWVSQRATPVPLHVGHLTHRRFLNFSPLPVSHHPPWPLQVEHGCFFGGSFLAIASILVLTLFRA
jgi:hypothetical protein